MSEEQVESPGSKRERSPNYPAFSLADAIERARKLWEFEKTGSVPVALALSHWGYTPKSSSGARCLSTMLAFELIEDVGKGDQKMVRLSERGRLLVRHPDPESDEYQSAIRSAALAPRMHREVWEFVQSNGTWPSDKALRWKLEDSHGFAEQAISQFLTELRATFALARIPTEGTVESVDQPAERDAPMPTTVESERATRNAPQITERSVIASYPPQVIVGGKPTSTDQPRIVFSLSGDNSLEISLRRRVSAKEFEKIKKIIELAEDSFVEPADPA